MVYASLFSKFMILLVAKTGIRPMPIYEYQVDDPEKGCERCRATFEYIQGMNEKPLSRCPHCGERVKRIISRCHAAVVEPSQEYSNVEKEVKEYERAGMHSHAAELADKYSHETNDNLLKERALENYKKAGYDFDSTTSGESA